MHGQMSPFLPISYDEREPLHKIYYVGILN